jgi:hypothetical protein
MRCQMINAGKRVLSLVLAPALLSFQASAAQDNPQSQTSEPTLTIRFVEGQGAINNVNRGTAFEPVIEVLNRRGQPVAGASVTFTLPAVGPGGTFPDGGKSLVTRTDENGRATARGLRPNRLAGQFEIRVTATREGESTTAMLTQTNAAPAESEHGSGRKWAIILGAVGAAAVVGIVAASGGGGSSAAPAAGTANTPPAGTVTPGAPGFGPPR